MKQGNITYKETPHLANPYAKVEETSSMQVDEEVNATIKKNTERANVEIEGKERVITPDQSAIFRAVGKRHSKGGMAVQLEPDSFVFSDDKSLAFTEAEQELFEFKKGGSKNPYNNTPSKVLGRNVPEKDYNKLVANLTDKNKDEISKRSFAMMLDKYQQTIGGIAYLQEAK